MNPVIYALNAVMPLILVAVLGLFLKHKKILSQEFLDSANKFLFQYGFMAVTFINVYKIETLSHIRWKVVLFTVVIYLLLFFLGKIYIHFFVKDIKQKWVIHETFFRSGFATIGIPLISSITGQDGLAMASILAAFVVPLTNILSVISYSDCKDPSDTTQEKNFFKNFLGIITNPFIIGVAGGLFFVALRPYFGTWRFSTSNIHFIYSAIDGIAVMTPWLSLLMIGGKISFSIDNKKISKVITGSIIRLIIAPTIALLIVYLVPTKLGLKPFKSSDMICFIVFFGTPVAISTITTSDKIGTDTELTEQIVAWTSICAGISLFIFVVIFTKLRVFS